MTSNSNTDANPWREKTTDDTIRYAVTDVELNVETPWQEQNGQLPGGGYGRGGKDYEGRPVGSWNRFGNKK